MQITSIGFIGGGRITRILLHAFTLKNHEFDSIIVYDTDRETLQELQRQFPEITLAQRCTDVAKQHMIMIALHPPAIMETLHEIRSIVNTDTMVVSLSPKISVKEIKSVLDADNIARLIPNATSYINRGYNPVFFPSGITEQIKEAMLQIFRLLGHTFETEERKLESYAIMSAMLPTYFWFQWEEMEEIGLKLGLRREESRNHFANHC